MGNGIDKYVSEKWVWKNRGGSTRNEGAREGGREQADEDNWVKFE
jgi:hypothetical protein